MFKKKSVILVLVFICLVVIGGIILIFCKKSTSSRSPESLASEIATVITKEGTTEKLTSIEICSIYKKNQARYNKYYYGGKISFIGTVNSVKVNFRETSNYYNVWDSINFKEGFRLKFKHDTYDLTELSEGDIFYVDARIGSGFGCTTEIEVLDINKIINLNGLDSLDDVKKLINE